MCNIFIDKLWTAEWHINDAINTCEKIIDLSPTTFEDSVEINILSGATGALLVLNPIVGITAGIWTVNRLNEKLNKSMQIIDNKYKAKLRMIYLPCIKERIANL